MKKPLAVLKRSTEPSSFISASFLVVKLPGALLIVEAGRRLEARQIYLRVLLQCFDHRRILSVSPEVVLVAEKTPRRR